jgi:predicted metal-dependent HD superfamily phosphohydrolase
MSFDDLCQKVFSELDAKLSPTLYYHCTDHTRRDVLPAAKKLCALEGLSPADTRIVVTAALFHDTGYLDQYPKNEPFGAKRAREELPGWGYSAEEIARVETVIMATQMPQNPGQDKLCQIMCDADLSHLGTEFFFARSEALRMELRSQGFVKDEASVRSWHESNLHFLESHSYWTDAARQSLGPRKERNIRESRELLFGSTSQ